MVKAPTRLNSILDLIFTNFPSILLTRVGEPHISDHSMATAILTLTEPRLKKVTVSFNDYKNFDYEQFATKIVSSQFDPNETNVDTLTHTLTQAINQAFQSTVKVKTATFVPRPSSFSISEETRILLRDRDKAYRNSDSSHTHLSRLVKYSINLDRKNSLNTSIQKLGPHKAIQRLRPMKKTIETQFTLTPDEVNDYFVSITTPMMVCSSFPKKPESLVTPATHFNLRKVNSSVIRTVWKTMKNKSSKSHDTLGCSNWMLLHSIQAPVICDQVLKIINTSFDQLTFPACLQLATVTARPKVDSPKHPSETPPIASLPVISKVIEKVALAQLTDFIENENILYPGQFGFRKHHNPALAQTASTELMY